MKNLRSLAILVSVAALLFFFWYHIRYDYR